VDRKKFLYFSKLLYVGIVGFVILLLVVLPLNVSKPGTEVEGCTRGCSNEIDLQAGPIRILSFNMLHGFPDFEDLSNRTDLIIKELLILDPDIILLQEVPWTWDRGNVARLLADWLGMNYVYYRANGNRKLIFFEEGEAIISRFPLQNVAFFELEPAAGLFEHRVVLSARVETSAGSMQFYITHLTNKDDDLNREQAASLFRYVESMDGGIKIIAGDFNAVEHSPQIKLLSAHWTDTYRRIHPGESGYTCCVDDLQSGPHEKLEKRIDYIFLEVMGVENVRLLDAQQVFTKPVRIEDEWQWASDHVGLMIEVITEERY